MQYSNIHCLNELVQLHNATSAYSLNWQKWPGYFSYGSWKQGWSTSNTNSPQDSTCLSLDNDTHEVAP